MVVATWRLVQRAGAEDRAVERARARVDTAFKYAAARDPARWGNRPLVQVGSASGDQSSAQAGIQIVFVQAGVYLGVDQDSKVIEHDDNQ